MRMTIILASICSLLISCATLTGGLTGGDGTQPETTSMDSAAAGSPDLNVAPAASAGQAYTAQEVADPSQASMEVQQAEHQEVQASVMNEQRSTSELDAAAPEGSGTDSFYASGGQPPAPSEVEQVTPEKEVPPAELPQKQVASWSQHTTPETSYEEPKQEKPSYKKSKKTPKKSAKLSKHDKKKIAKNSKKSKREIASKSGKKSHKVIAKKSKMDCKKITKNLKKSSKHEIAMCKAEKRKMASTKSGKSSKFGKVAKAGCQCNIR